MTTPNSSICSIALSIFDSLTDCLSRCYDRIDLRLLCYEYSYNYHTRAMEWSIQSSTFKKKEKKDSSKRKKRKKDGAYSSRSASHRTVRCKHASRCTVRCARARCAVPWRRFRSDPSSALRSRRGEWAHAQRHRALHSAPEDFAGSPRKRRGAFAAARQACSLTHVCAADRQAPLLLCFPLTSYPTARFIRLDPPPVRCRRWSC